MVKERINKRYELPTMGIQKSFYNKAIVTETEKEYILTSYSTNVCRVEKNSNTFHRTWSGYSVTTMKHINAFRLFCGLGKMGKKEWEETETENN